MVFFRIKRIQSIDGALLLGALVLVVLPTLVGYNNYMLNVFTHAFLLAALALAWNIFGLSGAISLGHAAFFGVGAYGSALLSLKQGLSPWLTIPFGGLLSVVLGLILNLLCQRLRGAYFALATLAFVEIPKVITDNWDGMTQGSLGLIGLPRFPSFGIASIDIDIGASATASYYLMFIYTVMVLSLVGFVFRSNLGLALQAIREEEVAAAAAGIPTARYRLLFLLLSSFLTGMSGACYAHLVGYIGPELVYGIHFSAIPMILAICGGRFTILGPALAALIIYPVDQFIFHPLFPAGHEFFYGLVLILTVLFLPKGIWGSVNRKDYKHT